MKHLAKVFVVDDDPAILSSVEALLTAQGYTVKCFASAEEFQPERPRSGGEAAATGDEELARFLHRHAVNRGVLLTPFHNMALMSPATTEADVDRHTEVFAEACAGLAGDA